MRTVVKAIAALVICCGLYLTLWPVPIDPVAWNAPTDRGYVDPFARNKLLQSAKAIALGHNSPEDADVGPDGRLYISTKKGLILRLQGSAVSRVADVGGMPLGIEVDRDGSLVVANTVFGLQRVLADGSVGVLVDTIGDDALTNANNLDIAADGRIFFSQSGTKFTAEDYGDTLEASLLDVIEHGGHGSVLVFDPASGKLEQLMTGLSYANGVAISERDDFLLVAETASYRIHKLWLTGARKGTSEILIDNLPGFPDNVRRGLNGRFWVGLVAPRNPLLDRFSGQPFIRKIMQRLPEIVRPKPVMSSHVIAIDGNGDVLMNLQDPDARFPMLTGVVETEGALFLTSLMGDELPVLSKSDL